MKTIHTDPIIEEFTGKIKKMPEVSQIILYGSRARSDFEEWSDYDVIVLVSEKNTEVETRIEEVAWDINCRKLVSIVPSIIKESRFIEDRYEPLFINVKREGVTL